ncbi:MAG: tetratricopeptide repeat protein [Candidatus Omnitrophica bacterium]|nr:tetratricopeptide repeat protein [Candidatus Omnitrophota bacterium]
MKSKKAEKDNVFLFLIFLAALTAAAFGPCLRCGFLNWDDYQHFIANPCVYSLSWNNICSLFRQTINDTYIPLTTLSFNLEYHLFGLASWAAHGINVLLHLAVVLLVFDFARMLGMSCWAGFIAAAVFAVHPMHVESVAWVTERKDVLGILFYMLCLKQYGQYLKSKSTKQYGLSLLFGFLSVLTKAMAVSIPWVLLLLDWFYQRRLSKTMIADKLPFAVLIFPVALITVFKLSPHPAIGPQSFLCGVWSFSWYLEKFFLPVYFIPAYSPALPVTLSDPSYILALVVFAVFLGSMIIGRKDRLFIFACLFWMATIFFFWRFDFNDNNIVADRFMYLPSLGFCLWLGARLSRFKAAAFLLIFVLGCMTFNQCRIWKNDRTLWTWTLKHDPRNAIAKGNQDEAIYGPGKGIPDFKKLDRAIDKNPSGARGYFDRGAALLGEGDYFLAFSDFNRAVKLDPRDAMAYIMRGQLYALRGKNEKALEDFDRAIALKTKSALAYIQKAAILKQMHETVDALACFDKAIQADPSMGAIYYQRGILYSSLGDTGRAVDDFTKSIALKNDLKDSYCRRAESYTALRRLPEAVDDFKRALQQAPYDVKVLNELGIAYLRNGNDRKALEVFTRAISLHPYYDNAYSNRGIVYIQQKKFGLALKDYTKAISLELYPYHALITRGDLYYVMGRRQKALKDYDLAILFSQGDPVARMKRDRLEQNFSR